LHIEAYHSQINNRKEENKQHTKIPKGNLRKRNWKEKSKKTVILLKERKKKNLNISSTRRTHAKLRKKSKKRHVTQN
jgi:tetraacyldisaccharide-1-P 4'-kinase